MDPYLEPHWLDVHTALIGEARRLLNRMLPAGLVARAEERIAIESPETGLQRVDPDVRVFAPSRADDSVASVGDVLVEAPYKLVLELEPITERFIRILDDDGQLIAVLEFISPTNKRGPGLADYRTKRQELLRAGVHVVEIDLVRAGDWRALMRPEIAPAEAATAAYRTTIRTAGPHPAGYLFPMPLREPLPDIPIPLRPMDSVFKLPLQAMIATVYAEGRYEVSLDYRRPLDPPIDAADAEWAAERIRQAVSPG